MGGRKDAAFALSTGIAHLRRGEAAAAAQALTSAVALQPDLVPAWVNLGVARLKLGDIPGAVEACQRAVEIAPQDPLAQVNLANVLLEAGRADDALTAAQAAVSLASLRADPWITLGHVRLAQGQLEDAQDAYEQALKRDPDRADIRTHLADALRHQGRWDEALRVYDTALEDPEARFGKGLVLLAQKEWADGLELYENRSSLSGERNRALFADRPLWDGSPLGERSLLVAWEQGFGDSVMFARFLTHLTAGRVTFSCQPALCELMALSYPDVTVVSSDVPPPRTDLWAPLASLPRLLNARPDCLPPPRLTAPQTQIALPPCEGLRVGLAWTSERAGRKVLKTAGLEAFTPLHDLPAVTFFGLQWGHGQDLSAWPNGVNVDALLEGFAPTAALLARLDLVISVDTVTAHMAASLGVPTWIVLPKGCDWRWGTDGETSLWYPSVRLFRQERPGDWGPVMARLTHALGLFAPRPASS